MLAVAVTSVMVAVALAPMLMTSADAARVQTCTNGGGQPKACGTPPANECTEKAGKGGGGGSFKEC